jgi:hypothetical protein
LQAHTFAASQMKDRQDANNGFQKELRFLIEPETPGAGTRQQHDMFYLHITDTVRIAFEIVVIETTSKITPSTQRYVCNLTGIGFCKHFPNV